MNDTPRTDAVIRKHGMINLEAGELLLLSRQLERELASLRTQLEEAKKAKATAEKLSEIRLRDGYVSERERLAEERAERLQAENKTLRDAIDIRNQCELDLIHANAALNADAGRYKDGFCVLLAIALRFDFFSQSDPIFDRVVEWLKNYPMREGVTVASAIDAAMKVKP